MTIDPRDYIVTEEHIRKWMNLKSSDIVINDATEKHLDKYKLKKLQETVDITAMYIRTRPDFFVLKDGNCILVEGKFKSKFFEVDQLFNNQQLEKMGIDVRYVFPDWECKPSEIPLESNPIQVSPRYNNFYHKQLAPILKRFYSNIIFKKLIFNPNGSGDPYIRLNSRPGMYNFFGNQR